MDITGEPDGPPEKAGIAIADLFTGLYGVIAIEAALIARDRTGRGQRLDLALFNSMSAMLANQAMNYLASGRSPKEDGQRPHQSGAVPDAAGCGWLADRGGRQRRTVHAALRVLGLENLAVDPRFATNPGRVTNRVEMGRELEAKTALWKRDELLAALEAVVVPAGPINTIADLFADPQFKARGMRIEPQGTHGHSQSDHDERKSARIRAPVAQPRRASSGDPARDWA